MFIISCVCVGSGRETEIEREWRLLEVRDQKISKTQFLGRAHHTGHVKKVNIRLLGYKGCGGIQPAR